MFLTVALFVIGNLFVFYTIALTVLSPGTFLDILTSFGNIWAYVGIVMILLAFYRLKHGHSFWSTLKKWMKRLILIFGGVCILIAGINLCFILTPKVVDMESLANADTFPNGQFGDDRTFVILLGGGIDKNGKLPKPVIRRLEKAAEYLRLDESACCVVTGGTLKWLPCPEAPEIKRQLVLRGIPEERILVEDKALDTIQNFQLSLEVLKNQFALSTQEVLDSEIIVVTSDYHLRRAERLAARMGFTNVKGLKAKTTPFYIPMSYLREICAYVKLNLRILLTGEPRRIA